MEWNFRSGVFGVLKRGGTRRILQNSRVADISGEDKVEEMEMPLGDWC